MRKRIRRGVFGASIAILLLTAVLVTAALYGTFWRALKAQAQTQAHSLAAAADAAGEKFLYRLGKTKDDRVTLLDTDGAVLVDTMADEQSMENHAQRPEVKQAVASGAGEDTRVSKTLGRQTYYYAVRLQNGKVLRVSVTAAGALGTVQSALPLLLLAALFAAACAFFVASRLSDTVLRPIGEIDPARPLETESYEELAPLVRRLDKQNQAVRAQMEELGARQREFEEITDHMEEGLAVFRYNGQTLSVNRAARELFRAPENPETALQLCRQEDFTRIVQSALHGQADSCFFAQEDRRFVLSASPVTGGGAVLLTVDVTEREHAEQLRREFSANVSHELKTPLTSIMGYAELIESGIAKPEDVQGFAGKIHTEAGRLRRLIEDIMELSRLDEDDLQTQFAPVDLCGLCREAAGLLEHKAAKGDVAIHVMQGQAVVNGVQRLLHEMVFNLIDNAVTYNKPGGTVDVAAEQQQDGGVLLTVRDTGIGIEGKDQAHVFERFYRADKSRSKATGGTGLGLSIVKHAALLHGAALSLKSTPGEGTTITVRFPAAEKNENRSD